MKRFVNFDLALALLCEVLRRVSFGWYRESEKKTFGGRLLGLDPRTIQAPFGCARELAFGGLLGLDPRTIHAPLGCAREPALWASKGLNPVNPPPFSLKEAVLRGPLRCVSFGRYRARLRWGITGLCCCLGEPTPPLSLQEPMLRGPLQTHLLRAAQSPT